jgi:hypothetical protein
MRGVRIIAAGLAIFLARDVFAADRIAWKGVVTLEGTPPPGLREQAALHLGVVVRQLGLRLGSRAPVRATSEAQCSFREDGRAACRVEVLELGTGHTAVREGEIPFRDVDDLSESIALLVADAVRVDLPGIVGVPLPVSERAEVEGELEVEDKTDIPAPKASPRDAIPPEAIEESDAGAMSMALEPTIALDLQGAPALVGASLRGSYASAQGIRIGAHAFVAGARAHRSSYDFDFYRVVAGPRIGFGASAGGLDLEVTAGPAMSILVTNANVTGGRHTLFALAFLAGPRASIRLGAGWALGAALDLLLSSSRELILEAETRLVRFGIAGVNIAVVIEHRF